MLELSVLQQLEAKQATVLTPNRRLAARLQERYAAYQQQQGNTVFQRPAILPLNDWLQRSYEYCYFSPALSDVSQQVLSPSQQRILWQQIIEQNVPDDRNTPINLLAHQAQQADEIVTLWELDLAAITNLATEETKLFLDWREQFDNDCGNKNLIATATLHKTIRDVLTDDDSARQQCLTENIYLYGFDDLPPALQKLIAILKKFVNIEKLHLTDNAGVCQRLALADSKAEIEHMARWAAKVIQEGKNNIACVVPNLTALRGQITRIFNQQLGDQNLYNLSAGQALTEFPIVHAALLALISLRHPLSVQQWSQLLRSPFFVAAEAEYQQRCALSLELQANNNLPLSIQQFNNLLLRQQYCSRWQQALQQIHEHTLDAKTLLTPSSWADYFHQQLTNFGWPGERNLSSAEYQTVQRWFALLNEFASLDSIIGDCDLFTALRYLQDVAENTVFQIQTPAASIQILGALEAAGQQFDAVWVMGMDHNNWPGSPTPNPLLPVQLQREHHCPHADSERELAFATQLIASLKQAAPEIIFSYAKQDGEQQLQVSPLLADVHETSTDELAAQFAENKDIAAELLASRDLEYFSDATAPEVKDAEKIYGGSFILQEQAKCPFRAFAHLRLHADGPEEAEPGLSPIVRGQLLHAALEYCWQQVQDQASLLAMSESQLDSLLAECIERAIHNWQHQESYALPISLPVRLIDNEATRLKLVLQQWLALECERPNFKVQDIEKAIEVKLGRLSFKLRIDRIDRVSNLGDGGELINELIIDYKTGVMSLTECFGERPTAVQLPLYALASASSGIGCDGVAFAQVRPVNMGFKGMSDTELEINGIKTVEQLKIAEVNDWSALVSQWRSNLEQLADEFVNGVAEVAPQHDKFCAQCDLHSLCRVAV